MRAELTIDCAVLGPHHLSTGHYLLVVGEFQVNGEGNLGASQGWCIVSHNEFNMPT